MPDLGGIYNAAAQHLDEFRNPVIVIPGILGSRLKDAESGRIVWGAFSGEYANPQQTDGARLVSLPMGEGIALRDLRDGVYAEGALDRVNVSILGLSLELNAYLHILGTLGVGGYRDLELGESGAVDYGSDHYTCFQFAYDWRRDNVENAKRLYEFIRKTRTYVQQENERRFAVPGSDVKFDIVAHSMGALITRYMLRYGDEDLPEDGSVPPVTWEGAKYVSRVILVGPPNAGSVEALTNLVKGKKFAPILPKYKSAVLGTMPAMYQLLPRPRHGAVVDARNLDRKLDFFDAELWEQMQWGLADPNQDDVLRTILPGIGDRAKRRSIALDHLRKCLARAKQFAEALDIPSDSPRDLELYLIAGDAMKTDAVLAVDSATGRLSLNQRQPGDGTVLRSSALMDERVGGTWQPNPRSPIHWNGVMFLFDDHLGLTRDPAFTDNVLFLLLEQPRN